MLKSIFLKICHLSLIAHLMSGLSVFADTNGVDTKACSRALTSAINQNIKGYRSLSQKQQDFLRNTFLPVTGKRGLFLAPGQVRPCISKNNCLIFPAEANGVDHDLRIEWSSVVSEPRIVFEDDADVLSLPKDFDFEALPDGGASLIKKFLIADSRHPFSFSKEARDMRKALKEPDLFHKEVQVQASQAVVEALERGDERFLFVAPTGTGKTEVVLAALRYQLTHSDKKLHILTADSNTLVDQLVGDLDALEDLDFTIIRWGGKSRATSFAEILAEAEKSTKPIVLVSTIQSLKLDRVDALASKNRRAKKKHLATLIYDEAHHSAADKTSQFLTSLLDKTDAFLFGTTATPVHALRSVQELYHDRAFWAYLDTPESYMTRPEDVTRAVSDVIEQLSRAIDAAESPSFDRVHFIDPKSLVTGNEKLYLRSGVRKVEINGNEQNMLTYVINPDHYETVAKRIQGLLRSHESGFISLATQDEVDAMTIVLNEITPGKTFAAWHADSPDSDKVLADFKAGRINYLVTCKRLDEGVNIPQMSLYIDLNKSVGPRQFLQRAGRVLRVVAGKRRIDIATLTEINEYNAQDMLLLLDRMLEGKLIRNIPQEKGPKPPVEPPSNIEELSDEEYRKELEQLRGSIREFWESSAGGTKRFRLSPEQHQVFAGENGMLEYLKNRFPGITINSTKLVTGLAESLPEAEQKKFIEFHGNLGNDHIVNFASLYVSKASRIIELLQDWLRKSAPSDDSKIEKFKLTLTTDQWMTGETGAILFGRVFIPSLWLTKKQHQLFTSKIGMLEFLKKLFPGITTKSTQLVAALAELLPEAEREDFIKFHGNLGNDKIVTSAATSIGAASRIIELLQDWLRRAGPSDDPKIEKFKLALTTDQWMTAETGAILFGRVFIPSLWLTKKQHQLFTSKIGMLEFLKKLFPGITTKSTQLVAALAELLPEAEREDFIKFHGNLGSDRIVSSAATSIGSASRIVELLQDWLRKSAPSDDPEIEKFKLALTTDQWMTAETGKILFGKVFIPSLSLTKKQHQIFTSDTGMLEFLKSRFLGITKNSTKLVAALAELLPEAEREDFIQLHGNLGNDQIAVAAAKSIGPAARIVELLQDWLRKSAPHDDPEIEKFKLALTTDQLMTGETGEILFGRFFIVSLSLTEKQHQIFASENGMLEFLKKKFPGITGKSTQLVAALAELLPEAEREDFIQLHGNLGNDKVVTTASTSIGAASRIIELLQDWLRKSAPSDDPEIEKVKLTADQWMTAETGAMLFGRVFFPSLSLTKTQHQIFTSENGMLGFLKKQFPGITTKSTQLVAALAELLPEAEREDFIQLHGNLGNDKIVTSAATSIGAASRIIELLQDWLRKSAPSDDPEIEKFKLALTTDQWMTAETGKILFGKVFITSLSLTKTQHQIFASETGMLEFLKNRFPGITGKSTQLVAALAELLPEAEREDFIKFHGNLGSEETIRYASTSIGSASRIVKLLQDWLRKSAPSDDPEIEKFKLALTTDQWMTAETGAILFGRVFIPSLSLTKKQHQIFTSENGMLKFLKKQFPGITKYSTKLVAALAEFLSEAERGDFIQLHGNLGSDRIVNSAATSIGSASRIIELLQDWSRKLPEKKPVSVDELLSAKTGLKLFGPKP